FMLCCCLFFFSSRRRHTRCLSDWSSDVCSSDLRGPRARRSGVLRHRPAAVWTGADAPEADGPSPGADARPGRVMDVDRALRYLRSEERRVGKECRSRGWACYEKKEYERVVVRWR